MMQKIKLSTIVVIGIFFVLFSIGSVFASIGAIGESFNTATNLGITGSNYESNEGIENDLRKPYDNYFVFFIDSSGDFTFRLEQANLSQHLELYNSTRVKIRDGAQQYWLGVPLLREKIKYDNMPSGLYFLRVASNNSDGTYFLTWNYDGSSSSKALIWAWSDEPLEAYNDNRARDWYYLSDWPSGTALEVSLNGILRIGPVNI